jgi:hypothetical protein
VVALLLLDELSGERAASARHDLANQRAALDHFADSLGMSEDTRILLEFEDQARVVSLAILRLCCERFALHVGWNVSPLEGDERASARLGLFRSDGVDTWSPHNDDAIAITSDVPNVYHADADMVLAALRRHAPTLPDIPPTATPVAVWLVLDENGQVEKTAVSAEPRARGRRTMGQVLLEPFPGESLRKFASAGTALIPAGHIGPNRIIVWWLQRRADVKPNPERGIYQFDSLRLLPPRSTLEEVVKTRFPAYARVGLVEKEPIPVRDGNDSDSTPDQRVVPWFIADDTGAVLESWLGPYLKHSLIARQMIEARHPNLHFTSVRIGEIRAENGSRPPIVWAILDSSSPLP